jgi:1,4-dihydroxy-2-naphthoate octaprenyltransferase
MSDRKINQPMLVVATLCLLMALTGLWLAFHDGGAALGLALLGFFGAGAYVLGRKALGFD